MLPEARRKNGGTEKKVRSAFAIDAAVIAASGIAPYTDHAERARLHVGTNPALPDRMDHDYRVTGLVIGCAIEVHEALGPGLKEQAYELALCQELAKRNIEYAAQPRLKVSYYGTPVGTYKPDLIVEQTVVVEIKSVDRLTPLFTSQVLAYLKITGLRVGLILNFRCATMKDGIKRVVL
jgi:GxxExxY protein